MRGPPERRGVVNGVGRAGGRPETPGTGGGVLLKSWPRLRAEAIEESLRNQSAARRLPKQHAVGGAVMALRGRRSNSLEDTISRISDDVTALGELMGETASEEAKASIRGLRQ